MIAEEVARYWSRPPSARNGLEVTLTIQLLPGGEVLDVYVDKSSGNSAFDRSAEMAVRKAEKLTVPENLNLFNKEFRKFSIVFRPEDLMW